MSSIRYVAVACAAAVLLAGGGMALVEHSNPARNFLCVGAGDPNTGCDLVWTNYSVESRKGDEGKVNCPKGSTSTTGECYQDYRDSRQTSSRWGTPANTPLVPDTTVGPLTVGVYYGTGAGDARVWAGLCVDKVGCGSAAAGAGKNANGDPYFCVTAYGEDRTDGHRISGLLNDAHISDDRSDYDSDGQVCGEVGRGV